jgi:hypothetical protein
MTAEFTQQVEAVLARAQLREEPPRHKPKPKSATAASLETEAERCRKWFAQYAAKRVMPMLKQTATAVKRHGAEASCRLAECDGRLTAELVIVPPYLPSDARPPRLVVLAAQGEEPLMVEFAGTFPYVGATGGFGAEVDYDAIFPSQLEEQVLDFVALATGA